MNENDARTGESTIQLTLGDADTAGHGRIEFLEPGAEQRIKDILAEKGGTVSVEVVESDQDTSGHAAADDTAAVVTLRIPGDDDTEGHAIAVHFPTARDARAFRNRLIVTGVIAGSVVAGAGAVALQSSGGEAASPAQASAADSVYSAGDVAATVGHEDSFAGSTYSQADIEATVGQRDAGAESQRFTDYNRAYMDASAPGAQGAESTYSQADIEATVGHEDSAAAAPSSSTYSQADIEATVGHEDSSAAGASASTYSQADIEATVGHEDSAPASGGTETESSNPRVPGPR